MGLEVGPGSGRLEAPVSAARAWAGAILSLLAAGALLLTRRNGSKRPDPPTPDTQRLESSDRLVLATLLQFGAPGLPEHRSLSAGSPAARHLDTMEDAGGLRLYPKSSRGRRLGEDYENERP